MSFQLGLGSPRALWRRMEREAYRAIHAPDRTHKSDHFTNFCIASHSMKDYFLEATRPSAEWRQAYYAEWAREPRLIAVGEIANASKHFRLRERRSQAIRAPKTRHVGIEPSGFVDVYDHGLVGVILLKRRGPDVRVVLSDGSSFLLYGFTSAVLEYWRVFLRREGMPVKRQSIRELMGPRALELQGRDEVLALGTVTRGI